MTNSQKVPDQRNRRSAMRLSVVVLAMFGFGFALVPLYDVFCTITGLNGKTGRIEGTVVKQVVDPTRLVTVQFLTQVNSKLNWQFEPEVHSMQVHPGQLYTADFFAKNLSQSSTVGQAVPSISPGIAGQYFNKTECFCFNEQLFDAGEKRQMPVRFIVDSELPNEIKTLTLSYTFFNSKG